MIDSEYWIEDMHSACANLKISYLFFKYLHLITAYNVIKMHNIKSYFLLFRFVSLTDSSDVSRVFTSLLFCG